jgi:hypothetical protein
VQNVTFGGVSASSFHVVSDTEIRATHPALAAGQYPVNAVTATGSIPSRATLVVTTPTPLPILSFLDSSPVTKGVVQDPERNALLVFALGDFFIERHVYNGSGWSSTSVTVPHSISRSGLMSPDGKEIVLLTQNNRILRLNAVTLAVLSATAPLTVYPANLQTAAVLNDGNVLVGAGTSTSSNLYLFNLPAQSFTLIPNSAVNMSLSSINVAGDGSHAILKYDNSSTPGSNGLYSYDAGTGMFAPITSPIVGSIIRLDRTGARILSNNSNVYDDSLALLGTLPFINDAINSDCTTGKAVISPDGTRAYTYCFSNSTISDHIYTYNLAATPVGGYFPAIGNNTLARRPVTDMQISGDGKTLFMLENGHAIMVSLP